MNVERLSMHSGWGNLDQNEAFQLWIIFVWGSFSRMQWVHVLLQSSQRQAHTLFWESIIPLKNFVRAHMTGRANVLDKIHVTVTCPRTPAAVEIQTVTEISPSITVFKTVYFDLWTSRSVYPKKNKSLLFLVGKQPACVSGFPSSKTFHPTYPQQVRCDVSIPHTIGLNVSTTVCLHAWWYSKIFYRMILFKGKFVGWTRRSVCVAHICQLLSNKKVSKEKAWLAVVTPLLWFTTSAVECIILSVVHYKKQPLT